jgi:hypothetical protein
MNSNKLATMNRLELNELRRFLLISSGKQHGTRNLAQDADHQEDELELHEDDDDRRRQELQEEKQRQSSPRSFTRIHPELYTYNHETMRRLSLSRDNRIPNLPSLEELQSKDCRFRS